MGNEFDQETTQQEESEQEESEQEERASQSVTVKLETRSGEVTLSQKFNPSVYTLKDVERAYFEEFNVKVCTHCVTGIRFIYDNQILSERNTLAELGIINEINVLRISYKVIGGGLADVSYDACREKLVVGAYGGKPFDISAFHVSCRSDKYTGEDMTGIVLYKYDNKTDWKLNNNHCKSGYIVLKLSKNIAHIKGEWGQVHGACYKWMFNRSIKDDADKIVGGGFAYRYGQWKFNSFTFNTGTEYHDNKKQMHLMEQQCIEAAIENWKKGTQNTYIKDIAKKYQGSCYHGWF